MAKKKKETQEDGLTTLNQLEAYLKESKDDHFNYSEEVSYKVKTGSLILDVATGGGIGPGLVRATGVSGGGKTSCGLAVAKDFQQTVKNSMVIHIKAEGRLSDDMIARAGVDTSPEKWFVYKSNIFESVMHLINMLIKSNPENKKYFFVIDSMDGLIRRREMEKSYDDAQQVGGGATITSTFLKKMNLAITEGGHICWMISQVRATIKADPRQRLDHRLTNASGGNAITHFANWIFEFQPTYKDDRIVRKIKGEDKIVGHWAKIAFQKTENETAGEIVKYPICHGRTNGESIWVEYEVFDLLLAWDMMKKAGGWFSATQPLTELIQENNLEFPETFHGEAAVLSYLQENKNVTNVLAQHFKEILLP
jgi:RecA/RadA recombinase